MKSIIPIAGITSRKSNSSSAGSLDRILLPKLESLKCNYWPEFLSDWVKFFKNHRHLQKLEVNLGSNWDYTIAEGDIQLVKLTSDLPELVELTIDYSKSVNIEDVIIFTQNHPKLLKVTFSARSEITPPLEINLFQEKLGNEWNVKSHVIPPLFGCYPKYELTLERKE